MESKKLALPEKLFGVYGYEVLQAASPFLIGFNDFYSIPESRHTIMDALQIEFEENLVFLSKYSALGLDMVTSKGSRDLYIFNHLEYDRYTLKLE